MRRALRALRRPPITDHRVVGRVSAVAAFGRKLSVAVFVVARRPTILADGDEATTVESMRGYYAPRAPAPLAGWLDALPARITCGPPVASLANNSVPSRRTPSNTPISPPGADGNTYQPRTLDDASVHEVLTNFPASAQPSSILGER